MWKSTNTLRAGRLAPVCVLSLPSSWVGLKQNRGDASPGEAFLRLVQSRNVHSPFCASEFHWFSVPLLNCFFSSVTLLLLLIEFRATYGHQNWLSGWIVVPAPSVPSLRWTGHHRPPTNSTNRPSLHCYPLAAALLAYNVCWRDICFTVYSTV